MKLYESKFAEPLIEDCGFCQSCGSKYNCFKENLAVKCKKMNEAVKKFNEKCPEGTKPKNGGCANADGNSYRRGVCDEGYTFDAAAGSTGKCVHKTDDSKHQARSER